MDFEQAVVDSIPTLMEFSKRYDLSVEDREDLVYNTVLKSLDNRSYFREGDSNNVTAWLITILKNSVINLFRKNQNHSTDYCDNEQMTLLHEQKYYSQDSDSVLKYNELLKSVELLVTREDFRIFMAYVNGYKYVQIAEILEKPLGTIKSRIFTVRKKLIKSIENG